MRVLLAVVLVSVLVLSGLPSRCEARSNSIILSDVAMGAGIGAGLGLVVGTIMAVNDGNWGTDLLLGAAWGTLVGAAGGFTIAMIEISVGKNETRDASLHIPQVNLTVKSAPNKEKEIAFDAKLLQVNF